MIAGTDASEIPECLQLLLNRGDGLAAAVPASLGRSRFLCLHFATVCMCLSEVNPRPSTGKAGIRTLHSKDCPGWFGKRCRCNAALQTSRDAAARTIPMGHLSIKLTHDLYGHMLPGNEAEAASLLDAYLGAAGTGSKLAAYEGEAAV